MIAPLLIGLHGKEIAVHGNEIAIGMAVTGVVIGAVVVIVYRVVPLVARAIRWARGGPQDMTPQEKADDDKDDEMGMLWWNALTENERAKWSQAAGNTGRAKDAWEAFKRAGKLVW
jgi:hypothetical protein